MCLLVSETLSCVAHRWFQLERRRQTEWTGPLRRQITVQGRRRRRTAGETKTPCRHYCSCSTPLNWDLVRLKWQSVGPLQGICKLRDEIYFLKTITNSSQTSISKLTKMRKFGTLCKNVLKVHFCKVFLSYAFLWVCFIWQQCHASAVTNLGTLSQVKGNGLVIGSRGEHWAAQSRVGGNGERERDLSAILPLTHFTQAAI